MKKTRKILAMAACAILLVCISVGATVAYLTSTDTVTNTFTVGKVKITLDEAKVGTDGKALTGEQAERVKNNSYHLYPGHEYDKDPTVTVKKGSDLSYIKMTVTINNTDALDALFAELAKMETPYTVDKIVNYNTTDWELKSNTVSTDANGNKLRTYEFWYKTTVAAPDGDVKLPALFTKISIPGFITGEQLADVADTEITVKAYAIQADGFADAVTAWAAYK